MDNRMITVSYKLFVKDADDEMESLIEEAKEDSPFRFISHIGVALPSFEERVLSLQSGESFDFVIPCKDAYGEIDDNCIFDVPKSTFEVNGRFDKEHIFEGNIIPLQDNDGQRFNAIVIEVKEDQVTLDLNHPHAGEDLHFVGKVLENREATNDELTGMLNMMSEGCGCDDCGDGCSDHGHGDDCHCGHCHH